MHPVLQYLKRNFALVSALFLTLITTKVRGHCNTAFDQCAKPLSILTDSGLSFATTKEDLDRTCPTFQEALKCIQSYTRRCMSYDQRKHFRKLFHGTSSVVEKLCRNGTYQEEYLKHAPCMKEVEKDTRVCFAKYSQAINEIQMRTEAEEEREEILNTDIFMYEKRKRETADRGIRNVCCSFQEYMECSTSTMRRACGEEAEKFSRKFLDHMSSAIIRTHCHEYSPDVCGIKRASPSSASHTVLAKMAVLFVTLLPYLR